MPPAVTGSFEFRAALSRREAAAAADISIDMLDRAIKAGELKAKRMGSRILIAPAALDAYIDSLPDA